MRTLLAIALIGLLTACTNPIEDLKSPCVGKDGGPCDRRTPSHQWLS